MILMSKRYDRHDYVGNETNSQYFYTVIAHVNRKEIQKPSYAHIGSCAQRITQSVVYMHSTGNVTLYISTGLTSGYTFP